MVAPNYARVTSLSAWSHFFHPTEGVFRLPTAAGANIEHLDIDLRFVQDAHWNTEEEAAAIYLPNVCKLTLRGGEFVQECEARMVCLSEVLAALSPVEVLWVNAFDHPDEQQTLSTVLVHPVIITAGELWQSRGSLRKLAIQGGFPVPNLSAPTPYSVTPAATPSASPGPIQRSFAGTPGFHSSGLPSLSLTKPKAISSEKMKERAERFRISEFELKPRWEFAFGSWGVQEIRWKFDGRYSTAAIKTVLSCLFESFDQTFPSTSHHAHHDLPSLITFSPIPTDFLPTITGLPFDRLGEHLADSAFMSSDGHRFIRAFATGAEPDDRHRMAKRLKAEMLLLQDRNVEIVEFLTLNKPASSGSTSQQVSPAASRQSMLQGDTDTGSDGEDEAQTPPMCSSLHADKGLSPEWMGGKVHAQGDGQVEVARRLINTSDNF